MTRTGSCKILENLNCIQVSHVRSRDQAFGPSAAAPQIYGQEKFNRKQGHQGSKPYYHAGCQCLRDVSVLDGGSTHCAAMHVPGLCLKMMVSLSNERKSGVLVEVTGTKKTGGRRQGRGFYVLFRNENTESY